MRKFYLSLLLATLPLLLEGTPSSHLKSEFRYLQKEKNLLLTYGRKGSAPPSKYVTKKIFNLVSNYIMPDNHPIKHDLDLMFLENRVFCDFDTMKAAGFADAKPQHNTRLIVTRHPDFPGYVFKVYLDKQSYFRKIPEYFNWIKRVKGARAIRASIKKHHYEHLFKVPQKWIYQLPDNPAPPKEYLRKLFILVEEDMDIVKSAENRFIWGSEVVTPELLDAFFTILSDVYMQDTTTGNCNFAHDGRIAFVDTESCFQKTIKHEPIMRFLSPQMKKHWLNLFYKKGIIPKHKNKRILKRH